MTVDPFRFAKNFLSSITEKIFIIGTAYHSRPRRFTHSAMFGGFRVALQFILDWLGCFIICLYVLSFMMGNPLRFPHNMMLSSSLPPLACMTGVVLFVYICVCLRITVSNASYLYIEHGECYSRVPGFTSSF